MTTDLKISPLETQVLGGTRWLKGSPAALRVLVNDHNTGKPVDAVVQIALTKLEGNKPTGAPISLYSGATNSLGTLAAKFKVGVKEPGAYKLTVNVSSPLGKDTVEENVTVEESATLMLTADKPLYQPGQTMHLRVLGLDMATRGALADTPVTFEIEDARGNKVYKKAETLSKFGLSATDFVLADEVNMGLFTVRAITPVAQVEKKVRVERYVLPKFKVGVKTDKPYYLPGDTVKGTVSANYFFGKPVSGGAVEVGINTVDIGVSKLTELKGKTDETGKYEFTYRLPQSFVGQPIEAGKAVVGFDVSLKDTAEHTQEAHASVPVVRSPVQLTIVSETRELVPGIANRFYIAASTPDGQPLTNFQIGVLPKSDGVKYEGFTTKTDGFGIAIADVTAPPQGRNFTLNVVSQDSRLQERGGIATSATQTLTTSGAGEGLILRPDRPIAKVGEKITFATLSTVKGGTLFLDIIKNRQTILTQAVAVQKGQARITLTTTPDMVGTLEVRAYKILPNEEIIRDTRTVIVAPADDLKISIKADKGEYKPGGEAVLKFTVTDTKNNPVLAALGLAVVDESVFALSELQPGLERIYFLLEKELMEPKYEIHGLRPAGLLESEYSGVRPGSERDAQRQRAASMLLAKAEPKTENGFYANTYTVRYATLIEKLRELIVADFSKIRNAVTRYVDKTKGNLTEKDGLQILVKEGYLSKSDLLDPWNRPYRVQTFGDKNLNGYFVLWTSGPDGKFDTGDDLYSNGSSVFLASYGSMYAADSSRIVRRGRGAGGFAGGFGGLGAPAGPAGAMLEERAFNAAHADRLMLKKETLAYAYTDLSGSVGGTTTEEPVRVREYFPETLFWNPSLLTDEKGLATLRLPLADSITTWRVSASANTQAGQLGSTESGIKVFQDFFADIDLPVSLTQNDRLELPVAVYNYLPEGQTVTLTLENEPWFTLEGDNVKTVKLNAGQVSVVHFPVTVKAIGSHALTVTARGTKLSDAIKRTIEVLPDGKEIRPTINDRLEGSPNPTERTINLSPDAIKEASTIFVKLYPGAFSQVVEGLDSILRMPNGCFEQTSSTTYPNVLVLDYLKAIKKVNPELQLKAEQYINVGYQRLVTFEVKDGGGFSWFGDNPAHQILTAYGLLEFTDMAKVHEVDPALIARTQNWLAGKMQSGGFWEEKNPGIAEGIINRQTGALRTTAYILWALAESGYKGEQVAAGVNYVKAHYGEAKDPYTLAVMLNLFATLDPQGEFTAKVAEDLIALAKDNGKTATWSSDTKTFTGAEQKSADLETTGLAAYGLVKWGRNTGFLNKVLTYLVQSKDSFGTWESTQGTVWAMKALLTASKAGSGSGRGTVTVVANGQNAATFEITPDNNDVMRQVDLKEFVVPGENKISLQYSGEGSLLYQIVGRYYLPWSKVPALAPEFQPIALKVNYDKTRLAQDDTATVTVTVKNVTDKIAEMPLIDVGVPPGFDVIPDALVSAVENKGLSKFTVAARQVILYLKELAPGQELHFSWQVRAKYPIRAQSPLSKAYPYYNPDKVTTVAPTAFEVSGGK